MAAEQPEREARPEDQASTAPSGPSAPMARAVELMQQRAGAALWDASVQQAVAEEEHTGRLAFTERYVDTMGELSQLRAELGAAEARAARAEEELEVATAALIAHGVQLQPLADADDEGAPPPAAG